MRIKQRNALVAAAATVGLSSVQYASAAPLVNVSVLASTSQNGIYSSTLQVTPGETVYYEVETQMAPVGTSNGNGKSITSLTANPTVNTANYDGVTSLSFNLTDAGTNPIQVGFSSNATLNTAGETLNGVSGDSWAGSVAAAAGTVASSGGGINNVLSNTNAGQNGYEAAATAPSVMETGSFVVGATVGAGATSTVAGTFGSVNGAFHIDSNPSTGVTPTADKVLITAPDTSGGNPYVFFSSLTLSQGTAASLVWSGATNGTWDQNTTANFTGSKFTDGSAVSFGDADGNNNAVTTSTVSIAANGAYPSFVTFKNTTNSTYTVSDADATNGISGNSSVTLTGGGTVVFNSPNNYTGGTTITTGTLKAAAGSLNSTGAVTIGAGGNLYVGTVSGAAHSTLATGAQTWMAGGTYSPKVSGDGTADLMTIGTAQDSTGGTLTIPTTGTFNIVPQVGAVAVGTTSGQSWELAAFNSTIVNYNGQQPSGTGVANGVSLASDSQFALNTSAISNASGFSLDLVELSPGHDALYLEYYSATPEPGTAMLVLGGVAPMLLGRRRRSQKLACPESRN